MRRTFVLAAVLCLAAVALLGVGAAPAAAATCTDCHTTPATPPAPALHAPFVATVTDCATCHKGMTVPHPEVVKPNLTVRIYGGEFFATLGGGLSIPWVPLADVTIYPQSKAADATDWTTLKPLSGAERIATGETGMWGMGVLKGWPPAGASLRAISEGVAGPPVVMPGLSAPFTRPFPTLTLKLRGLTDGAIEQGQTVTARGTALPVELAGQKVLVRLQRARWWAGNERWLWSTLRTATRTIGADGDFSARLTPKAAGRYRVRAIIEGTAAYRAVKTDWRRFRVE
jgi:hypothetical protein